MKMKCVLSLSLCLSLVLTGCDNAEKAVMQSQISESRSNNVALQARLTEVSSSNLILQEKVKTDEQQNLALRQQIELANSKIDEVRKDRERLQAENEKLETLVVAQRTKQEQLSVGKNIDKILARLDRLRNEQAAYSFKTDNERKREEERLKQLANTEHAQIKEIVADLRSMEFSNVFTAEFQIGRFVSAYGFYVGYLRMWSDAFGRQGLEENERKCREEWQKFRKEMDEHFEKIKALKTPSSI